MNGNSTEALDAFLLLVQQILLLVFTLEVVVKVVARGNDPFSFFSDPEEGSFNM